MAIDTGIRHVANAGVNLLLVLGFSTAEAEMLHAASRKQINDTRLLKVQLMVELSNWITEHHFKPNRRQRELRACDCSHVDSNRLTDRIPIADMQLLHEHERHSTVPRYRFVAVIQIRDETSRE